MDPMSPKYEVKEEIKDNIDIVKNEIEIKTEAKEFLSCCNKGEEECYLLYPAPKHQLSMDPIMSPMFEVKEEITVADNEIGIGTKNEIKIKTEVAVDCIDYNCCCYCSEELASAEIRDKHEVQCHMGPQLIVRLSVTDFQDAAISNCQDDESRELISQSSKQKGLHQQLHLHCNATKYELRTYNKKKPRKISPSDGETAEDHYMNENYRCDQCDYKTRVGASLKRHKLKHDVEGFYKKYKCELCAYKTYSNWLLKRHKLTHETHQNYKCDQCDYKTHISRNLKLHKLKHETHKSYKCDQCDYKTHISHNLKPHKLKHDVEGKKYKCELCDYKTHFSHDLKRHKLKHDVEGIHKYKCELCDYETHCSRYLTRHKLKHGVEGIHNKYKCEVCDYKTHFSGYLNQHIKLKHDLEGIYKKYKCEVCDYRTHSSYHLKQHELKHDVEEIHKKYKCELCDYKTHRIGDLNKHKLTHKKYKCELCGYKTNHEFKLNEHKLKHDVDRI